MAMGLCSRRVALFFSLRFQKQIFYTWTTRKCIEIDSFKNDECVIGGMPLPAKARKRFLKCFLIAGTLE